jgi:hypothetical protein
VRRGVVELEDADIEGIGILKFVFYWQACIVHNYSMNNKYVIGIMCALAVLAVIITHGMMSNQSDAPNTTTSVPDKELKIIAPLGWVIATNEPYLLLIKDGNISARVDAEEMYAYGEFMLVERADLTTTPQEWLEKQVLTDDPLIMSAQWVSFAGRDMYEVIQRAAGADGDQVSYYYFTEKESFVFSLYPYTLHSSQNEQGIADLQSLAQQYIATGS